MVNAFPAHEGLSWRKAVRSWDEGRTGRLHGEGRVSGNLMEAEKPARTLQAAIMVPTEAKVGVNPKQKLSCAQLSPPWGCSAGTIYAKPPL